MLSLGQTIQQPKAEAFVEEEEEEEEENPERMSYRSMLSVSSCQENEAGIQKVVCFE